MRDYVIGLFLGGLCGFLLGILVVGNTANWKDKMACEENLPRNVECVWSQP